MASVQNEGQTIPTPSWTNQLLRFNSEWIWMECRKVIWLLANKHIGCDFIKTEWPMWFWHDQDRVSIPDQKKEIWYSVSGKRNIMPYKKDKLCFMFLESRSLWFVRQPLLISRKPQICASRTKQVSTCTTYKMLHGGEHDLASFTETEIHTQTAQKLFRNLHD